ncbi:MAG: RsmE family RNA methyltransferase [Gemmatimonadota bacterium]|nr:RsmE family RNA methyltransferase [Gemmatimonadota bacterium]
MITVLAAPGSLIAGQLLALDDDEVHHLGVRRAEAGELATAVDGAGARAWGVLEREGKRLALRVETVQHEPAPPVTVLALGAGDRDRFGQVADQAAALGATVIVPLETERSLSVATRLKPAHLERMQRRATDALKQCGAAWSPGIAPLISLTAWVAGSPATVGWLADAHGGPMPALARGAALTIAVGPEGGFTEAERAGMLATGFTPVRCAPAVLRFETAALAALTTAWQARQRGFDG